MQGQSLHNAAAVLGLELGGKPKWLPLSFEYNDKMCMVPILDGVIYPVDTV